MKRIFQILAASVVILLGLMAIHGSEGHVGAYPENLFTSGGGHRLEYATLSKPQPNDQFFEGHRRHFGFPCWALYVDVSEQTDAWYAKLDLPRLIANWLFAVLLALVAVLFVQRLKPNHAVERTVSQPTGSLDDGGHQGRLARGRSL